MQTRLYLLLLLLCCMCSCNRYYYKPNGVNAPLLTKAGDAHLSASATPDFAFTDVQASYSPINHVGFIGNFSTFSYKAQNVDVASGNVDGRARLAELGAGYYYVAPGKAKVVCDIYAGAGGGNMQSDVNMSFFRSFIQPGVGIRTPYFEFSLNYRMSAIRYSNLNTNGHDSGYLAQQNLIYGNNRRIDNTTYLFAEPAITFRGGYKFIKVQTQYVVANALSHVPWQYYNGLFNVGFSFELEELLKVINPAHKKNN